MINDRIFELIKYFADGNKRRFSQLASLSPSVIENLVGSRQGKPSFEVLEKIIIAFANINADWLITGRGEMLLSNQKSASGEGEMLCKENGQIDGQVSEKSISESISLSISLPAKDANLNANLTEKNVSKDDEILYKENGSLDGSLMEKEVDLSKRNVYPESNLTRPSVDIVSIPIVEISVAAGDGYYNGDTLDVIDSIQLPQSMVKRGSQYFCVRVKGESMAPTLLDSSFLVIRLLDRGEWEFMPEEQVYVVTDREGKAYVKRVKNRLDKGFVVCMSDNPDKAYYPNFNLQTDEIHTIWHAEWYISAKMPNIHQTYYTKVSNLEDEMAEMRNDIGMLKRLLKH